MSSNGENPKGNGPSQTPIHQYFYWMVELAAMRMMVEQGVFEAIPETGEIAVAELALKTRSQESLLQRFINFLVSAKVLTTTTTTTEFGRTVAHTPQSRIFRDPKATLFTKHLFDLFMIPAVRWTEFFDQVGGFAEPTTANNIPYGLAVGQPGKSLYEILEKMPERAHAFNATMAVAIEGMPATGMYDFSWVARFASDDIDKDRVLLVDLGGGKGQALKAIFEENPGIPARRCVIQDLPGVIDPAGPGGEDPIIAEVVKVGRSLFDEVLVKGALIYHIRRVLNDWSDKECLDILQNVRKACSPSSRVLISEQLLDDRPSLDIAAGDLWMLNFGGKRRSERMFAALAAESGFELRSVARDKASASAVIELGVI